MSGSATLTVGSTLRYAEDDGSTVELLVEGQWLSGGIAALDGDGVMLTTDDSSTLVRLASISVVKVYAAGAAPQPAVTAPAPVVAAPVEAPVESPAADSALEPVTEATPERLDEVVDDASVEELWLLHHPTADSSPGKPKAPAEATVEIGDVTAWYHDQLEQLAVDTPTDELDAMWAAVDDDTELEALLEDPSVEPDARDEAEVAEDDDDAPLAEVRQLWAEPRNDPAEATLAVDETEEAIEQAIDEALAASEPESPVFERVRTVETDDWRAMLVSLREEAGSREVVPAKRSGWRIGSSR